MLVDISHVYVQSSISNNVTALHISSRLGSPIHKSGHKLVSFVQQSVDASGVRMTEHLPLEEGTSGRIKFCAERSSERSCIEGEMPSIRIVACDMQQRHLCQALSNETGGDEGYVA
jgi:hypothetical protein